MHAARPVGHHLKVGGVAVADQQVPEAGQVWLRAGGCHLLLLLLLLLLGLLLLLKLLLLPLQGLLLLLLRGKSGICRAACAHSAAVQA